jgi:hypothetical protein
MILKFSDFGHSVHDHFRTNGNSFGCQRLLPHGHGALIYTTMTQRADINERF